MTIIMLNNTRSSSLNHGPQCGSGKLPNFIPTKPPGTQLAWKLGPTVQTKLHIRVPPAQKTRPQLPGRKAQLQQ
jgi:hypothetical protein